MSHARNSGYCSRHSRLLVSEPTSKLSISGLDVIQIESDRRMTVPQDKSALTIQLQLVDLDDDVNPSGVYFDVGHSWDHESLVRQIDAINLSSQYPISGKPVDLSLSPSMLTMLEGL
ncbi:hypothetical protein LEN26_014540 [Aphanomyces euteiches]|nr:hypothetical protein LEN26_014540 [Aphanomyces euteiches]KAH9108483.1 hypothetical protein AeMF1_016352 [Aphanomyces euteiches]KAH9187209.1 hypothetical protein AeNC1_010816 [Aphanomyces euteiches]